MTVTPTSLAVPRLSIVSPLILRSPLFNLNNRWISVTLFDAVFSYHPLILPAHISYGYGEWIAHDDILSSDESYYGLPSCFRVEVSQVQPKYSLASYLRLLHTQSTLTRAQFSAGYARITYHFERYQRLTEPPNSGMISHISALHMEVKILTVSLFFSSVLECRTAHNLIPKSGSGMKECIRITGSLQQIAKIGSEANPFGS